MEARGYFEQLLIEVVELFAVVIELIELLMKCSALVDQFGSLVGVAGLCK